MLIEMTDKSTNQLRLANEKSVKSPTKQKIIPKQKKKKYEQEQELINVKITDIIENLITPLKLENGKLKEALQNALDKIENWILKYLIVPH